MNRCPRVLKDERRECARNQPDTHTGNLNLSIAGTCAYEHGYDLAGSPLFGRNHGLANAFILLHRSLREKRLLPNLLAEILIYLPTDFPQILHPERRLWLLAGLRE